MKPALFDIDLYFITDSKLTKKSILDDVNAAIKAGVKIIQYREKEKTTKKMYEEAKQIKKLCDENNVLFLINDKIDICLSVGADGVHIGNEDLPYAKVRELLGDKIIGVTVHDVDESIEAENSGADYVGVSPIFNTATKKDAGPAAGLKLIEEVKKSIKIPQVAIGGINLENIDSVVKAGSKSAAVISAIITKDDVEEECRKFINKLKH
ncbi:MAG: thiamine phosphate synthase [Nanoarchaeota archaeon]|nr:thiamine phosphate synthase [Nanoarchaeota archaeon]